MATTSSSNNGPGSEEKKEESGNDSDWSDIESEDDENRSLRIDLKDEVDDVAVVTTKPGSAKKSKSKRRCCSVNIRKPVRKAKMSGLSYIEVPAEIATAATTSSFEKMDKIASKLRLNRTQVKSVIKSLVEAPQLLHLVKEMAGDDNKNEAARPPEMRVTRTLAKNVAEGGGKLGWFLEKVNEKAKTPAKKKAKKQQAEPVPFISAELPDEDDEEYDPNRDPVAFEMSDDDSMMTGSESGTPSAATQSSPASLMKTPVASVTSSIADPFKKPEDIKAVRTLGFDEETEAQPLTRSKANLKEVSIEELDVQFVPPDITPDMYDHHVDDYTLFLAETFGQPVVVDDQSNQPPTHNQDEEDPDFVYVEKEEDVVDEFKYNKSTKIPQKEADLLMQELFEAYELSEEKQKKTTPKASRCNRRHHEHPDYAAANNYYYYNQPTLGLTQDQYALVAQQMRQHIQLTTQMALLTSKDSQWDNLHKDCRGMLSELVNKSFSQQYSIFAQDNLFPSLKLLNEWDSSPFCPTKVTKLKKANKLELSNELMDFVGNNTAFIYPQLLPTSALKPRNNNSKESEEKIFFSPFEDHLIALGLEQYFHGTKEWMNGKLPHACKFISQTMIRGKTARQMRVRIKNRNDRYKSTKVENPISYYYKHNVAQHESMNDLMPYDSGKVVAPKDAHYASIPEVWREHFIMPHMLPPTPPNAVPITAVVESAQLQMTEMPAVIQSTVINVTTPKFRPSLKSSVGTKSPSKLQRDRLLKKYSPMKRKRQKTHQYRVNIPILPSPAVKPTEKETTTVVTAAAEQPIMEQEDEEEEDIQMQSNILDAAMEECGINQDMPMLDEQEEEVAAAKEEDKPMVESNQQQPQQAQQQHQAKVTRKTKQQKEAELTLQLLEAEKPDEELLRKEHEALEIVMTAKEELDEVRLQKFYQILVEQADSPAVRFTELHKLCQGRTDLQEMLLDILTTTDAMALGLEVYKQYCLRANMKQFFRRLRLLYSHQPSVHTRILKEINTVLTDTKATLDDIKALGNKLFKSNQLVYDEFMSLMPGAVFPESMLPDPEHIDLGEEEDDEENIHVEKIHLPESAQEETDYGGDNCPCACHPDPTTAHCIHCSLKFVNGKVYSRDGKCLRPVKVQYPADQNPFVKGDKKKRKKRCAK